jgi:hypothetical protein
MKEFIGKYQKAIVGTGAVAILLICYLQQKELAKLRKEQNVSNNIQKTELIDSLRSELFVKETIIMRYEVALDMLKEDDKKAADKFELILTTQTE